MVLATPFQLNMLVERGQNGIICMDATHGTTSYGNQLASVLVIDEYGNGVLAAFCISSGSSEVEWTTFLTAVKEAIAERENCTSLTANCLMTDNDPSFFHAWTKVIGPVKHRLLCSWHVDQAW